MCVSLKRSQLIRLERIQEILIIHDLNVGFLFGYSFLMHYVSGRGEKIAIFFFFFDAVLEREREREREKEG